MLTMAFDSGTKKILTLRCKLAFSFPPSLKLPQKIVIPIPPYRLTLRIYCSDILFSRSQLINSAILLGSIILCGSRTLCNSRKTINLTGAIPRASDQVKYNLSHCLLFA